MLALSLLHQQMPVILIQLDRQIQIPQFQRKKYVETKKRSLKRMEVERFKRTSPLPKIQLKSQSQKCKSREITL